MHYINGLWNDNGARFSSLNPATQQILWQGGAADISLVSQSVHAARAALYAWSARDYAERYQYIEKFKNCVEAKKEELAQLIALETGKVWWDARSEVAAVIGKLGFSDEAYRERTGHKMRDSLIGQAHISHRPHGVMAVYGPYNFPAHLPNGHITPALLAGNTIVFKPSEQTPAVAEWIVKQWAEVELPAGVLNLVQGERDTGIALAQQAIDGVLFTGSSATGKMLHAQFGGRPEVILALEMGGNNPLIIFEVSNLEAAVYETMLSAFTSSGQRCTCARRLILAPWAEQQKFIDLLIASSRMINVGAYDAQPTPFMGPVISLTEAKRLLEAQENLEKLGGKVLLRMTMPWPDLPFVTPCIIDMSEVTNVPDEEYFGPLLQLFRVESEAAAVRQANATAFGLSASIFADDYAVYQRLSLQIRAGLVNWNRQTTGASGAGPFGGVGVSGNHRPAGYYAADYCAYPVASIENQTLALPSTFAPGIGIGR